MHQKDYLLLALFVLLGNASVIEADSLRGLQDIKKTPKGVKKPKPDSCLRKPFRFTASVCDYERVVEEVSERMKKLSRFCDDKSGAPPSPKIELHKILNVTTDRDVKMIIERACKNGKISDDSMDEEDERAFLFELVTGKDVSFNKEFFDGGTYWNEEVEYVPDTGKTVSERPRKDSGPGPKNKPKSVLKNDARRVKSIAKKLAVTQKISFPENIPNFDNCQLRSAMCCWVSDRLADKSSKGGSCQTSRHNRCTISDPKNNTDICYVDMSKSKSSNHVSGGFSIFDKKTEGPTYCHGFAWSNRDHDITSKFKGNTLFHVGMSEFFFKRGYVKNLPGAPMCGCLEQMPVVTRADCSEVRVAKSYIIGVDSRQRKVMVKQSSESKIEHVPCKGVSNRTNDLESYYERIVTEGGATETELDKLRNNHIVGENNCPSATETFLKSKGFVMQGNGSGNQNPSDTPSTVPKTMSPTKPPSPRKSSLPSSSRPTTVSSKVPGEKKGNNHNH